MKLLRYCILLLLFTYVPFGFAQYFVAPIGYLPDPNIVYHDGWYYYMGTSGGSVRMKRAQTLEGLKQVYQTTIFGPSNGGPCCKYWAPELHRINNKWYIYFTAKQNASDPQHMWVIENDSNNPMEGPWVNRGRLFDPANDFWAIDGTAFELNGSLYYVYSGVAKASDGDKPQRLYIARMSNPWTLSSNRMHLSSPTYGWERDGLVNEGPAMLQANGKTFLVYSGSGCWTSNYALGMLWIDDWEDPMNPASWEKLDHAVFSKDASVDAFGTGHNSFFKSPNGKEVWMAYHATPNSAGACDMSRATSVKKITFDDNGFPVFGKPTPTGKRLTPPQGEVAVPFKGDVVNGIYKIQASSSTRPLDVSGCSPERGANVQQWESYDNDCQKWHIQATEDGHYWIGSARGGLTMEVQDCATSDSANVRMWTPSGANCQKWDIIANGDGTYRIASVKSGKVLDIQFGGDNNGANLQVYSYLGNPQQHFQLTLLDAGPAIETGLYNVISKRSNLALTAENCNGDSDDNIVQSILNKKNSCQQWYIKKDAHHFYTLRSNSSGGALDVSNCSTQKGANVATGVFTNSECQQYSFVHVKDEWYTMITRTGGLAVDVAGCKATDLQNIALWTNWQGDCQLWRFDTAETGPDLNGKWTGWLDRDDPSGSADNESGHANVCKSPTAIEARVRGANEVFTPGLDNPEIFAQFSVNDGLVCINSDQTDGRCNDYEVRFLCLNDSLSSWRDRDDPGGTGDYETNDSGVCNSPSAIEARIRNTSTIFTPGKGEPENFAIFNPAQGLACKNQEQSDASCNDYEVRYLCLSEFYSDWYDRDDPSGTADNEARPGEVCHTPIAIEARERGANTIFTPGNGEPETFQVFNPKAGLVCINQDQADGSCKDYEVRFLCQ